MGKWVIHSLRNDWIARLLLLMAIGTSALVAISLFVSTEYSRNGRMAIGLDGGNIIVIFRDRPTQITFALGVHFQARPTFGLRFHPFIRHTPPWIAACFPIHLVAAAILLAFTARAWQIVRKRASASNQCLCCGYDCSQNREHQWVCPECGALVPSRR